MLSIDCVNIKHNPHDAQNTSHRPPNTPSHLCQHHLCNFHYAENHQRNLARAGQAKWEYVCVLLGSATLLCQKVKSHALSLLHIMKTNALSTGQQHKKASPFRGHNTHHRPHKIPPPLANPVDKPSGISLVCNWQSHHYPQAKNDKINQAPLPHTQNLRFLVAATLPTHNSRHLNWLQPT